MRPTGVSARQHLPVEEIARQQTIAEPIADDVDADLAIVDLHVLGSALLGGEDLQRLVARSDVVVELRAAAEHEQIRSRTARELPGEG